MKKGFGARLKRLRKERSITQQQLADIIGCQKTTVSNYETETSSPDMENVVKIAEVLKVSTDVLLGVESEDSFRIRSVSPPSYISEMNAPAGFRDDTPYYQSKMLTIPIVGYVRAGEPILADEHIIDYLYLPQEHVGSGELFALKIMGDSMNMSKLDDGDIALIRKTPVVDNGDIAVVLVDGENATVKQFFRQDNIVTLIPNSSNKANRPRCIDITKNEVLILGKVIKAIVTV